MKKRFLALAIVLGTGLLSGCTNAGEKTAVSYKGGTISEQEVMDSLKKMQGADSAVQQLIVYQVFEDKYGDDVSTKEIDSQYDQTKKQLGDSFDSQLKSAGYTEQAFKDSIKQSLAFQEGLKKHIKLTDEDLKTAWESFHPEVEAQIIQVASEDDAKDVKKAADNGDDFSKLAKDKSTDTTTKEDGGKVKFDSTTTTVPAEVKEAAFKLKDGQVSDVITSTNASTYTTEYYVVKMVKNQNKGNDMDKYKKELKEIATDTKLSDSTFQNKVIGEVLKDANVKIKDKDFENVLSTFTSDSSTASSK
ncbi:peptidyl-prolyl cis-trans isomerase [Enterococcus faecium]|uniref:peptidylprolyl isomerase n=1 Tax=Enterococcus faecium TaxID=1352 RepID=UPI0018C29D5E|nr:peptidylprolyl isomerase [Enterococcus faecium]EKC6609126.1 peptidyl-prolyl cis-trans isomerase [Enterococcus faecium]EKY7996661.1 peptidyl-prolyl cis-trans isomerase [Enterococcus faecium]MBG0416810.1 peptidyl-prolyl cis-trans isomerase [Enterococcus faecium]MBG0439313.1 peptidyl-prolyl cis-trans isomerase [Enterococcus faecium]MBG0472570.1 peptidyl-prolyl cis-trans isomerase [Enterococcus faecium]